MFCPIALFQIVRFQKFLHKQDSFYQDNCFEYQQPYVIFKTECFVPYLHSKLSDFKNSFTNRGSFFQNDHCEHQQCYVIFKIEHFVPQLCSKLSDFKNSFTNRGHFFRMIIVSTNNAMLSSKLSILSHSSVPSCQISKIPSQIGVIFSE